MLLLIVAGQGPCGRRWRDLFNLTGLLTCTIHIWIVEYPKWRCLTPFGFENRNRSSDVALMLPILIRLTLITIHQTQDGETFCTVRQRWRFFSTLACRFPPWGDHGTCLDDWQAEKKCKARPIRAEMMWFSREMTFLGQRPCTLIDTESQSLSGQCGTPVSLSPVTSSIPHPCCPQELNPKPPADVSVPFHEWRGSSFRGTRVC